MQISNGVCHCVTSSGSVNPWLTVVPEADKQLVGKPSFGRSENVRIDAEAGPVICIQDDICAGYRHGRSCNRFVTPGFPVTLQWRRPQESVSRWRRAFPWGACP